jgi:DNA-binding transcriptional MerR regulator
MGSTAARPVVRTTAAAAPAPGAPAASPRAARAVRHADPVQEYFSIGEVCALTELRPHVLRYWETQFRALSPAKNRSGNRVYARREVELVLLVKHLLYTEKYTVDGARQKLDEHRRAGALRAVARTALAREVAEAIERDLSDVLDLLEGRRAPRPLGDAPDACGPPAVRGAGQG